MPSSSRCRAPRRGTAPRAGSTPAGSGNVQESVVRERHGLWGRAIEVPGSGALNKAQDAVVISVSCASAGNCAAGGFYTDGSGNLEALVVSERHGVWGRAIEVPGSGALNKGGLARINSASCASAGNCAAGGFYADGSGNEQAFVVSEQKGVWGRAIEVPGSAALNKGRIAVVSSVSCAAAGTCAAGAFYTDGSGSRQAFVVSEQQGVWARAIEVPGLGALNKGGDARVNSVSCPSAGNCAAGGNYFDGPGHRQGFVVNRS